MKSLADIAAALQGYDPQALTVTQVGEFLAQLAQPLPVRAGEADALADAEPQKVAEPLLPRRRWRCRRPSVRWHCAACTHSRLHRTCNAPRLSENRDPDHLPPVRGAVLHVRLGRAQRGK
jgi:hypothetical protein